MKDQHIQYQFKQYYQFTWVLHHPECFFPQALRARFASLVEDQQLLQSLVKPELVLRKIEWKTPAKIEKTTCKKTMSI